MGVRGQPRPSRLKRVILVALLVLIVAPIVGYFTVPAIRDRIDGLIDSATVAFTLFRHPSENALDGDVGTVWLSDPGTGAQTVTVNFDEPKDLAGMVFQIGAAPGPDYASHARPRHVELVFPGDARTVTLELNDDPAPQRRCLRENQLVGTFNMRIVSVYPAAPGGKNLVGLRDVVFLAGSC